MPLLSVEFIPPGSPALPVNGLNSLLLDLPDLPVIHTPLQSITGRLGRLGRKESHREVSEIREKRKVYRMPFFRSNSFLPDLPLVVSVNWWKSVSASSSGSEPIA